MEPNPVNRPALSPIIVQLKKGAERRLLRGHDWIFSNEIKAGSLMPGTVPGRLCHVQSHQGKFLATAYYNPKSLIAARVVSHEQLNVLDLDWVSRRIQQAVSIREIAYKQPFYRAVFGESDGLPGLVIDRFGENWVVQITTAGMEQLQNLIREVLHESYHPQSIVWRADDRFRELEGLEVAAPQVEGECETVTEVREGTLAFETSLTSGQKTGWFFDQRDNRFRLAKYAKGRSVLDVFSYAGAWAVHGLAAGATSATCIDSSETALDLVKKNGLKNGFEIETIAGDGFDEMKKLLRAKRRFDIVIVDPPALIKRKKDHDAGLQAYYQVNRLATQLVSESGGLLVSCSCSQHLTEDELLETIRYASMTFNRSARVLEFGTQSLDHPIHPAMPETRYLKTLFTWLS